MDSDMKRELDMLQKQPVPGMASMGRLTCRTPEITRESGIVETTTESFAPDSLIETEFGYAEGYFRRFYETPMIIQWEEGPDVIGEGGLWVREKRHSYLPWPLQRSLDVNMPEWFPEFIERLKSVERYLYAQQSFTRENGDAPCCLCDHVVDYSRNFHFVLGLDAYEETTEIRWPALLMHYLVDHRVLPSRMFSMVLLERKM